MELLILIASLVTNVAGWSTYDCGTATDCGTAPEQALEDSSDSDGGGRLGDGESPR
jgi:hypothetical protein